MTRILIIEDEDLIRDSLEDLLISEGFDVLTADDGKEGIAIAQNYLPDLIICDVMMPVLNGYEVLQQIRQNKLLNPTPFLFLTSMVDRTSNRRGMNLGADDYLEKPCTKNELLSAIATRLNKQKEVEQRIEEKMNILRSSITLALPHEFQTPLSGIMGLSDLMMEQSQDLMADDIYEYAQGIYNSAQRLHRLIQNYLLYSKITVWRSQSNPQFDSICSYASQAFICDLVNYKAKHYNRLNDVELDIQEAELLISTDNLSKIIEELLDNAFKYSVIGSKVRICTTFKDKKWTFTIEDHGRGMSSEQISLIGAYMQFDRQVYEQQGIGLGLSIVKGLVDLHHGCLEIDSQANIGTKISVIFSC
ncbi:MAG: response regulator [Pseudanabaenaceae cyanobacterium bins.39]|nr:response regulator [Pseudanabaenaceae cyanobacterium bins.39]